MGKSNKKQVKSMEELTEGFDEFMKDKEINEENKEDFEELLKKSANSPEDQQEDEN